MSYVDDMMGGRWERAVRQLKVEAEGWVRGSHIPTALHNLYTKAKYLDEHRGESTYQSTLLAVVKLQREITIYHQRLRKLAVATEQLYEYLEAERRLSREGAPEISLDIDDLMSRITGLYGKAD